MLLSRCSTFFSGGSFLLACCCSGVWGDRGRCLVGQQGEISECAVLSCLFAFFFLGSFVFAGLLIVLFLASICFWGPWVAATSQEFSATGGGVFCKECFFSFFLGFVRLFVCVCACVCMCLCVLQHFWRRCHRRDDAVISLAGLWWHCALIYYRCACLYLAFTF